MEIERYSILDCFKVSLTKPKKIVDISEQGRSVLYRYVIFLVLLTSIAMYVIPAVATVAGFGGFRKLFTETVPELSVSDGTLTADKRFEMVLSGLHIYIDTTVTDITADDLTSHGTYLGVTSNKISMFTFTEGFSGDSINQVYSLKVSDVLYDGFTNSDLTGVIPIIYIAYIFVLVLEILLNAVKYLLLALIYTVLITTFLASATNRHLDTVECFRASCYASTWQMLIVSMNAAMAYPVPAIFTVMAGVAVSIGIITYAFKGDELSRDEDE